MTDDALSSFVDAFRVEHSARSLDQRGLRQRIVAAAGRRRVRRTERMRLLLSLAATFAGSAALAASPPVREHVREAFSFVRSGVAPRAPAAPAVPVRGGRKPVAPAPAPSTVVQAPPIPVASPVVAPAISVASPVVAPPSVSFPAPARFAPRPEPPVERAPAPASTVASLPSTAAFAVEPSAGRARPAPSSSDLALYRRAHELHFGGADRARTLAAWDAYLAAFPHGTFAPEARLNRAVCLAKLGRKAEAEGVLGDIERGRFGKDGRRQARKILGALGD